MSSSTPLPAGCRRGQRFIGRDGKAQPRERTLAAEVPVSITYNGLAYAVMMASPLDIEDFVTGFSLTEEVVSHAGEIEEILVRPIELGLLAQARIPAALRPGHAGEPAQPRGPDRLRHLRRGGAGAGGAPLRRQQAAGSEMTRAVFAAWDSLSERQPLNARTGAVHAAAFADAQGRLLAVREDVGRHNALDKLIGHLARAGIPPSSGFCLMTSRISFELVQKCLASGIPALVGISAPTSLAVRLSQEHNLTLAALAREDGFQVFSDPYSCSR